MTRTGSIYSLRLPLLLAIAGVALLLIRTHAAEGTGKTVMIHGAKVYYEEMGQGVPVVYTPGGRHDLSVARAIAEKLAKKYHVIIWERAITGRSDVVYTGARDVDMWSDQLAELLRVLGMRPAYLTGPSLGARTSYI